MAIRHSEVLSGEVKSESITVNPVQPSKISKVVRGLPFIGKDENLSYFEEERRIQAIQSQRQSGEFI